MPSPVTDRNLLFAVLALQNELVGKDQVLAAMHAWVLEKHRPLGELLVERSALDPDDRQALDALLDRQVRRHGSASQSLAVLEVSTRTRSALAAAGDVDIEAGLAMSTIPALTAA